MPGFERSHEHEHTPARRGRHEHHHPYLHEASRIEAISQGAGLAVACGLAAILPLGVLAAGGCYFTDPSELLLWPLAPMGAPK